MTLAECCVSNPTRKLGAVVNVASGKMRKDALLFGESQSRIVISARQKDVEKILQIAKKNKVPVVVIGEVSGQKLAINKLISARVADLDKAWSQAIESQLRD